MTREELRAMGIEDEQIDKIMASHAKDIQAANSKAEKYKGEADRAAEYKAQLDALNEQNLTDIEKANKATETANSRIAELEKQIARSNNLSKLAEMGITGEDAEKLLSENGIDYSVLSQIIANRENTAAIKKEQEIASKAGNPSGGIGGNATPEKTSAEKVAESVSKVIGGVSKASADIISNYTN